MSNKKYVVPPAMFAAAAQEFFSARSLNGISVPISDGGRLLHALEAAIRWLDAQIAESSGQFHRSILEAEGKRFPGSDQDWKIITRRVDFEYGTSFARNYIRRMFESPEAEVPDAVKDLLLDEASESADFSRPTRKYHNAQVIEAYNRGKAGK